MHKGQRRASKNRCVRVFYARGLRTASAGPWATLERCTGRVLAACKALGMPSKQAKLALALRVALKSRKTLGFAVVRAVRDSADRRSYKNRSVRATVSLQQG